jgi:DNA-binding GntR family transcriptional regulator
VLSESYNFRLAIEPQSLFAFPQEGDSLWLAQAGERHRRVLSGAEPADASSLSRLDSEFHRQLVRFSGNRFMIEGINQQIEMTGLLGQRRIGDLRQDLEEHLAIIAALQAGQNVRAARIMAQHLTLALDRRTAETMMAGRAW